MQVDAKTLRRDRVACPAVWSAQTLDGEDVHILYQFGTLSVRAQPFRLENVGDVSIMHESVDGGPDAYMEDDELLERLRNAGMLSEL